MTRKTRKGEARSAYTPDVVARVCTLLVQGLTLRQIGEIDGLPAKSTIIDWLEKRPEFRLQYAAAREAQALVNEDEIVEIADDASRDYVKRKDGSQTFNKENVMRSVLRVDTRKWLMSKRYPKRYHEKLALEHSGAVEVGSSALMELSRKRLAKFRHERGCCEMCGQQWPKGKQSAASSGD